MLRLKRVVHFNEFLKCKVSGEVISYGDYYYEDDEDGLIVKASVYKQLQREKQREKFDYSRIQKYDNYRDYKAALVDYEREFLAKTVLERKVEGKEVY